MTGAKARTRLEQLTRFVFICFSGSIALFIWPLSASGDSVSKDQLPRNHDVCPQKQKYRACAGGFDMG